MDKIDELISRFKRENTRSLENIKKSQKTNLIRELEPYIDDPRVIDLFLAIAKDEKEYDLARIEVLKIFEIADKLSGDNRNRVAESIRIVMLTSIDDLVRSYAGMAGASYMDFDGVARLMEQIVQDAKAPEDLRYSAFGAIRRAGPSTTRIQVLRALLGDEAFKKSAARVLGGW